jgi:hypothetical protein
MAKGGKRAGAGRKPGKTLKLLEILKQEHIDEFIEFLIDNYKEDARLMMWMGDHIFGKAPQAMEVTGKDGEPLAIQISETIAKKNKIDA